MSATISIPTSPLQQKHNLLTLPPEIRQQIYTHAFANLSLHPIQPHIDHISAYDCDRCRQTLTHTPLRTYNQHFRPLLTCKSIYTEALPLFLNTLTLTISDHETLDTIHRVSPLDLRKQIRKLDLTVHLTYGNDPRLIWHASLLAVPQAFPNLTQLHVHHHMRAPTSYDRLVDAIYIAGPLVSPSYPAHLRGPPGLTLEFMYCKDEVMFESPLLGEITTEDAREAHEQVIREVMKNEAFVRASATMDWELMTEKLLEVARGYEERWVESLQRRRLGGLTVRELQERILRSQAGADGDEDDLDVGLDENEEFELDSDGEEELRRAVERQRETQQSMPGAWSEGSSS